MTNKRTKSLEKELPADTPPGKPTQDSYYQLIRDGASWLCNWSDSAKNTLAWTVLAYCHILSLTHLLSVFSFCLGSSGSKDSCDGTSKKLAITMASEFASVLYLFKNGFWVPTRGENKFTIMAVLGRIVIILLICALSGYSAWVFTWWVLRKTSDQISMIFTRVTDGVLIGITNFIESLLESESFIGLTGSMTELFNRTGSLEDWLDSFVMRIGANDYIESFNASGGFQGIVDSFFGEANLTQIMESFAETNNLSELVEAFIDRNSTSKLLEEFVEKINVTQLLEHFSEPRIITNTVESFMKLDSTTIQP